MTLPIGYDPITLNHYLWYHYQCHEADGSAFQRLFERIIKRAKPEFVRIRPYGNIGDRKCDGLLFVDDSFVIFQVYSPDELKQAEVLEKISDDLAGAVAHWKDTLREWWFVYNARRGLAPDIPMILHEQQKAYPSLHVDRLDNEGLWEMARSLSLQQRAEVLGAPAGYEHLFFQPGTTPEEIRSTLDRSWFVFVQDTMAPIGLNEVVDALAPDIPFGAPVIVRPIIATTPWDEAAHYQRQVVNEVMQKGRDIMLSRFAVFSLAQIPLAIHLGFVLSDRVSVQCFQFDRERRTWRWPDTRETPPDTDIRVTGLPNSMLINECEVVIRVSLSAQIAKSETDKVVPAAPVEIDIFVADPDVMWLNSPAQLARVGQVFRQTLAKLHAIVPNCSLLHLFYAGPTGGAVTIGQQINPRMNPVVRLYQYSLQTKPRYQAVMTLTEEVSV